MPAKETTFKYWQGVEPYSHFGGYVRDVPVTSKTVFLMYGWCAPAPAADEITVWQWFKNPASLCGYLTHVLVPDFTIAGCFGEWESVKRKPLKKLVKEYSEQFGADEDETNVCLERHNELIKICRGPVKKIMTSLMGIVDQLNGSYGYRDFDIVVYEDLESGIAAMIEPYAEDEDEDEDEEREDGLSWAQEIQKLATLSKRTDSQQKDLETELEEIADRYMEM